MMKLTNKHLVLNMLNHGSSTGGRENAEAFKAQFSLLNDDEKAEIKKAAESYAYAASQLSAIINDFMPMMYGSPLSAYHNMQTEALATIERIWASTLIEG